MDSSGSVLHERNIFISLLCDNLKFYADVREILDLA